MAKIKGFIKMLYARYVPVQLKRLRVKWRYTKPSPNGGTAVFYEIYKQNKWGSPKSRSGGGSHISTTVVIRAALPVLWRQYEIKTFLDIPCGDYHWMKEVPKDDITYIGGDIVSELIDENNEKHRLENVTFEVLDITQDALPKVDMIFCKDCLQHLSHENALKALRNMKKSGSKYLLTTSYPKTLSNWDIQDGDYRPLNLRKKPFKLPAPLHIVHETSKGVEVDKQMYLYELEDVNI